MPDLFEAAAERDEALRIVGDNAADWMGRAVAAIRVVAEKQPTLTSADVWGVLGDDNPPEPRAMGAAFVRARSEGIVDRTGLHRATERANARQMLVWASLLYRPNGWELQGRERKAGTLARAVLRATPDRARSELADALRSLPLAWWDGMARTLDMRSPSEATVIRAIEIIEEAA